MPDARREGMTAELTEIADYLDMPCSGYPTCQVPHIAFDKIRTFVLTQAEALAASQQEVERLREQVRLANIDAANTEAEANDLRTALAAAREDSARLDWLETRHAEAIPCQTGEAEWDGWNIWDDVTHKDLGDGDTLRAALDTARSTDAERRGTE